MVGGAGAFLVLEAEEGDFLFAPCEVGGGLGRVGDDAPCEGGD